MMEDVGQQIDKLIETILNDLLSLQQEIARTRNELVSQIDQLSARITELERGNRTQHSDD